MSDEGKAQDSIELWEEIDPNYVPPDEEVTEYAKWLGMDLSVDPELIWIAREGLRAPLPSEWKPCKTKETGDLYYFNFSTGESTWDHPCDIYYKRLYEEEKKKKESKLKESHDQKKMTAKQEIGKLLGKDDLKKKKKKSLLTLHNLSTPGGGGGGSSNSSHPPLSDISHIESSSGSTTDRLFMTSSLTKSPLPGITSKDASRASSPHPETNPSYEDVTASRTPKKGGSSLASKFSFASSSSSIYAESKEDTQRPSSNTRDQAVNRERKEIDSGRMSDTDYALSYEESKSDRLPSSSTAMKKSSINNNNNDNIISEPNTNTNNTTLTNEIEYYKKRLHEVETQCKTLQQVYQEDQETIERLQTDSTRMKNIWDEERYLLQQKVTDKQKQLQETVAKLDEVEDILSEQKNKVQVLQQKLTSAETLIQAQHQLTADMETKFQHELLQQRDDSKKKIYELKSQYDEKENEWLSMKIDRETLQQSYEKLLKKYHTLEHTSQSISITPTDNSNNSNSSRDKEESSIQEEKKEAKLNEDMKEKDVSLNRWKENYDSLQRQYNLLKAENIQLKIQVDTIETSYTSLQSQYQSIVQEREELKHKNQVQAITLSTIDNKSILSLSTNNDDMMKTTNELLIQQEQQNKLIETKYKEQLNQYQTQITTLESRIHSLMTQQTSNTIETSQQKSNQDINYMTLNLSLDRLQVENKALKQEVESITNKWNKEKMELKHYYEDNKSKHDTLYAELLTKYNDMTTSSHRAEIRINELESENTSLKIINQKLKAESGPFFQELFQQAEQYKKTISDMKAESDMEKLQKLQSLSEQESIKYTYEKEKKTYEKTIHDLENDIVSLQVEISTLKTLNSPSGSGTHIKHITDTNTTNSGNIISSEQKLIEIKVSYESTIQNLETTLLMKEKQHIEDIHTLKLSHENTIKEIQTSHQLELTTQQHQAQEIQYKLQMQLRDNIQHIQEIEKVGHEWEEKYHIVNVQVDEKIRELETLRQEYDLLKNQYTQIKAEYETYKLTHSNNNNDDTTASIVLQEDKESNESNIVKKDTRELSTTTTTTTTTIAAVTSTTQDELAAAVDIQTVLLIQINQLTLEIDSLKAKETKSMREFETLEHMHIDEIQKYKFQLEEARSQYEALKQSNEFTHQKQCDEINNLKLQILEKDTEIQILQHQIQQHIQSTSSSTTILSDVSSTQLIQSLRDQIVTIELQKTSLQEHYDNQLNLWQNKTQSKEDIIVVLQHQIGQYEQQVKYICEQVTYYQQQLQQQQSQQTVLQENRVSMDTYDTIMPPRPPPLSSAFPPNNSTNSTYNNDNNNHTSNTRSGLNTYDSTPVKTVMATIPNTTLVVSEPTPTPMTAEGMILGEQTDEDMYNKISQKVIQLLLSSTSSSTSLQQPTSTPIKTLSQTTKSLQTSTTSTTTTNIKKKIKRQAIDNSTPMGGPTVLDILTSPTPPPPSNKYMLSAQSLEKDNEDEYDDDDEGMSLLSEVVINEPTSLPDQSTISLLLSQFQSYLTQETVLSQQKASLKTQQHQLRQYRDTYLLPQSNSSSSRTSKEKHVLKKQTLEYNAKAKELNEAIQELTQQQKSLYQEMNQIKSILHYMHIGAKEKVYNNSNKNKGNRLQVDPENDEDEIMSDDEDDKGDDEDDINSYNEEYDHSNRDIYTNTPIYDNDDGKIPSLPSFLQSNNTLRSITMPTQMTNSSSLRKKTSQFISNNSSTEKLNRRYKNDTSRRQQHDIVMQSTGPVESIFSYPSKTTIRSKGHHTERTEQRADTILQSKQWKDSVARDIDELVSSQENSKALYESHSRWLNTLQASFHTYKV